jgi:hypothetical protein
MRPADTSQRAAERHIELYRQLGPAGRSRIAAELSDAVRATTLAGIRQRNPEYSAADVARVFIEAVYGIKVK